MGDTLGENQAGFLARPLGFSEKARWEMAADGIGELAWRSPC